MDTFTEVPSYTTALDYAPKIREVTFGDSYAERAPDGLNNNPRVFNVVFVRIPQTDALNINAFLKQQGGVSAFIWVPPDYDTASGTWVCKTWNINADQSNSYNITAKFEEVFQPTL